MLSVDEDARKRFESDWLSGRSLSIKEYLPDRPSEHASQADQKTYLGTLEELVCIDLEFRWRSGEPQASNSDQTVTNNEALVPTRIEDYLREFPELSDEEILTRLVEQEIYVRVNAGYVVEPGEYQARFPTLEIDESLFSQEQAEGRSQEFPKQFGPYVLTGLLGRGGMGSVYRAEQPSAGRQVAIKVAELSSLPANARTAICKRFKTEAHAAASLVHDHSVPIFDVGEIDNQPYYAMRLVEGGDLGKRSKEKPLPAREAARYILGIAKCMFEAHERGMLHRDIKPQNILVDVVTDRAMLTDFGLARFTDDGAGLTQTGQLLGTPSFMPPEQIRDSSKVDHLADVYSIGASLYQMLTGKPPFRSAEVAETLRQVSTEDPVSPSTIDRSIDRDLDTICLKCLEKEPESRYQNANELAQDLQLFLDGKPIQARPISSLRRLTKWSRRNRKLATAISTAIAATLFALVASVTGLLLVQHQKGLVLAQKKNVEKEKQNVEKENQRNLATLKATYSGLDDFKQDIENEPLLRSSNFAPTRKRILGDVRDTYGELEMLFEQNPDAQIEFSLVQIDIARLDVGLKSKAEETETRLADAMTRIQALKKSEDNSDARLVFAESEALLLLSRLRGQSQENEEALKLVRQAAELRQEYVDILTTQAADPSKVAEAKRKVANAWMNEGLYLRRLGELDSSIQRQVDAQKIRTELAAQIANLDPESEEAIDQSTAYRVIQDEAKGEFNLSLLELGEQEIFTAQEHLEHANQSFERLLAINASDSGVWELYCQSRIQLAGLLNPEAPKELQKTEELIKSALTDIRALIQLRELGLDRSLKLLMLHQLGIEVMISRKLVDSEDALDKVAVVLLNYIQSHEAEGPLKSELSKLELHHHAQFAVISRILDSDFDLQAVSNNLDKALMAFASHAQLVSQDRALTRDLSRLTRIQQEVRLELESLKPTQNGENLQ